MIVLDDDSVSSHHAEIFRRDGVYCVRDLGSTNGSTLNGNSVTDFELNSGDIVSFGTIETTFLVIPQTQEASDSEDQASTAQPNDSQGSSHQSLRDKIKQFGQAAWAETKRSTHLVSLKAQIEKLTRMDLRHAFHDLGKTCYESKIGEEKFAQQFQEIRSLKERIVDKRKGVHAEEGAKTVGKLKAAAQDQAGKIAAEALNVKLGGLFVGLGKAGESQERDLMPKEHLEVIDRIQQKISDLCSKSSSLDSVRPLNTKTRKLIPIFVFGLGILLVTSWILWANVNGNDSAPKVARNDSPILGVQYSQMKNLYPDLSDLSLKAWGEEREKRPRR